jgi:hypothetical protein
MKREWGIREAPGDFSRRRLEPQSARRAWGYPQSGFSPPVYCHPIGLGLDANLRPLAGGGASIRHGARSRYFVDYFYQLLIKSNYVHRQHDEMALAIFDCSPYSWISFCLMALGFCSAARGIVPARNKEPDVPTHRSPRLVAREINPSSWTRPRLCVHH